MGSWNGTCLISDLPILEGEKVTIIPVAVTERKRLELILAPMFGVCGDGGRPEELIDNRRNQMCIDHVVSNTVDVWDKALIQSAEQRYAEREKLSELMNSGDSEVRAQANTQYCELTRAGRKELSGILGKFMRAKDRTPHNELDVFNRSIIMKTGWTDVPYEAAIVPLMIHGYVWDTLKAHVLHKARFTRMLPGDQKDPVTGNGWMYVSGADFLQDSLGANLDLFVKNDRACEESAQRDNPDYAKSASNARWRRMTVDTGIKIYAGHDELAYSQELFIDMFAPNGVIADLQDEHSRSALEDMWILGTILSSMRKELRIPAGTGSQAADYSMNKALGTAMCEVADRALSQK